MSRRFSRPVQAHCPACLGDTWTFFSRAVCRDCYEPLWWWRGEWRLERAPLERSVHP